VAGMSWIGVLLICIVDARSILSCLWFRVKWMSWYLSGANLAPCRFAQSTHLSCAFVSAWQLSLAVLPHVIIQNLICL
jgi:hypothetical protein